MSTTWVPPSRAYYLRVFVLSLVLLLLGLAVFLFGVRMEAIAPATGLVGARDLQEIRAPQAGLVEPGWYESELPRPEARPLRVRLDAEGHGVTDPAEGSPQTVRDFRLVHGEARLRREELRFHRLEAGDELWPGQVIATVRPEPKKGRTLPSGEFSGSAVVPEDGSLRPVALRVPENNGRWLTVAVRTSRMQAVKAGDVLATMVPLDPDTGRPRDLLARLDLSEKHCADLVPGQAVRLFSTMYNHRLHGHAEAVLERLEPWGEAGVHGERRFHAVARLTHTPFNLPLGSSFKAEVVLGKKPVYRIILEQ